MSTLTIEVNASHTVDDVLISDMGMVATKSTQIELTTQKELDRAIYSSDLLVLAADDLYGANSSTLILTDGTYQIDSSAVSSYLSGLGGGTSNSWFGGW